MVKTSGGNRRAIAALSAAGGNEARASAIMAGNATNEEYLNFSDTMNAFSGEGGAEAFAAESAMWNKRKSAFLKHTAVEGVLAESKGTIARSGLDKKFGLNTTKDFSKFYNDVTAAGTDDVARDKLAVARGVKRQDIDHAYIQLTTSGSEVGKVGRSLVGVMYDEAGEIARDKNGLAVRQRSAAAREADEVSAKKAQKFTAEDWASVASSAASGTGNEKLEDLIPGLGLADSEEKARKAQVMNLISLRAALERASPEQLADAGITDVAKSLASIDDAAGQLGVPGLKAIQEAMGSNLLKEKAEIPALLKKNYAEGVGENGASFKKAISISDNIKAKNKLAESEDSVTTTVVGNDTTLSQGTPAGPVEAAIVKPIMSRIADGTYGDTDAARSDSGVGTALQRIVPNAAELAMALDKAASSAGRLAAANSKVVDTNKGFTDKQLPAEDGVPDKVRDEVEGMKPGDQSASTPAAAPTPAVDAGIPVEMADAPSAPGGEFEDKNSAELNRIRKESDARDAGRAANKARQRKEEDAEITAGITDMGNGDGNITVNPSANETIINSEMDAISNEIENKREAARQEMDAFVPGPQRTAASVAAEEASLSAGAGPVDAGVTKAQKEKYDPKTFEDKLIKEQSEKKSSAATADAVRETRITNILLDGKIVASAVEQRK
jgi:hypothetical protein